MPRGLPPRPARRRRSTSSREGPSLWRQPVPAAQCCSVGDRGPGVSSDRWAQRRRSVDMIAVRRRRPRSKPADRMLSTAALQGRPPVWYRSAPSRRFRDVPSRVCTCGFVSFGEGVPVATKVADGGAGQTARGARASSANGRQSMADLIAAMEAAAGGDFSVRVRLGGDELEQQLGAAFNRMVEANARMTSEIARVRRVVGRDGLIAERASAPLAGGAWQANVDSINALIDDLVRPATEFARVIDAVAKGDLSQKMAVRIDGHPVKGEFLRIRTTVNSMVDRLSSFAGEVTRVAREVGTEGKLGGQAKVKGVSGT